MKGLCEVLSSGEDPMGGYNYDPPPLKGPGDLLSGLLRSCRFLQVEDRDLTQHLFSLHVKRDY